MHKCIQIGQFHSKVRSLYGEFKYIYIETRFTTLPLAQDFLPGVIAHKIFITWFVESKHGKIFILIRKLVLFRSKTYSFDKGIKDSW